MDTGKSRNSSMDIEHSGNPARRRRRWWPALLLLLLLLVAGGAWRMLAPDPSSAPPAPREPVPDVGSEVGDHSDAPVRQHVAAEQGGGASVAPQSPASGESVGPSDRDPRSDAPPKREPETAPAVAAGAAEIEDEPTTRVVVHVSRGGLPVAGAKVSINYDWRSARAPVQAGTTSEGGDVTVDVVAGVSISAFVRGDELAPTWSDSVMPAAESATSIHIVVPNLRLTGRAVDSHTGTPLEGIEIRASQPFSFPAQGGVRVARSVRRVHSSADGTFEVDGLAEGDVELVVEPVDGDGLPRRGNLWTTAGSDHVEFEIERLTVVRLVAEDGMTGEELTELDLRCARLAADGALLPVNNRMQISAEGVWPPDGCFELPGPGPHRLQVVALGYERRIVEATATEEPIVELRVPLRKESDGERPRLILQIVDEAGEPVEDAQVVLEQGRGFMTYPANASPGGEVEVDLFPGPNSIRVGSCSRFVVNGPWNVAKLVVEGASGAVTRQSVTLRACGGLEIPEFDGTVTAERAGEKRATFVRHASNGEVKSRRAGPIPVGTWTVTVRRNGDVRRGELVVRQGRTTQIDPDRDLQPYQDE